MIRNQRRAPSPAGLCRALLRLYAGQAFQRDCDRAVLPVVFDRVTSRIGARPVPPAVSLFRRTRVPLFMKRERHHRLDEYHLAVLVAVDKGRGKRLAVKFGRGSVSPMGSYAGFGQSRKVVWRSKPGRDRQCVRTGRDLPDPRAGRRRT